MMSLRRFSTNTWGALALVKENVNVLMRCTSRLTTTMSPKYKLTYFNISALGEPVRYVLAYSKQDFQDIRINPKDWPNVKSEYLLQKLPVLEIDGKAFHQSLALCRYLAKQCGLSGKDDLENLQIDMAAETFNDFRLPIWTWFSDPDEKSKAAKQPTLLNEHMPKYLGYYEDKAKENGGYFVGGRLTWADLYFIGPLNFYREMLGFDMLEKYPTLKSLEQKVKGIPQIASYLQKRPPVHDKLDF